MLSLVIMFSLWYLCKSCYPLSRCTAIHGFLLWIAAWGPGEKNLGFPPPFFWFLSDVFVIWLWFFYWRKEQGSAHLSNALNMSVNPTKNFLGAFEKKFRLKSEVLSEYSSVISASFFQNFNFFSKVSRKFSVDFTGMFKVSERSNWLCSLRQ